MFGKGLGGSGHRGGGHGGGMYNGGEAQQEESGRLLAAAREFKIY